MDAHTLRHLILNSEFAELWPTIEAQGRHGYAIGVEDLDERFGGFEPAKEVVAVAYWLTGRVPREFGYRDSDGAIVLDMSKINEFLRAEYEERQRELRWSVSESHLGGLPRLPRDFDWPKVDEQFCQFLGQIALNELPEGPARAQLPRSGRLLFFAHQGCDDDLFEAGKGFCRFVDDSQPLEAMQRHPRSQDWLESDGFFSSDSQRLMYFNEATLTARRRSIRLQPWFFLPNNEDDEFGSESLWNLLGDRSSAFHRLLESEYESWFDPFQAEPGYDQASGFFTRLLGHLDVYQHVITSTLLDGERGSMRQPVLLFQMHRQGALAPEFYFFIESDDLAAGNFDNVVLVYDYN